VANEFLAQKRLALVGVSRDPKDFSRVVFRELRKRGYDLVPVNPAGGEIEGCPAVARCQDIQPPVAGALVMTRREASEQVVLDCADAGIPRVWLHRGVGPGSGSPAAVEVCRRLGIQAVVGECPYMFLPNPGFLHRAHGALRRWSRRSAPAQV
jgi:predicted CoA-binding protein